MRPERFQAFALDTLKNTQGTVQVQTLADAGDTKHPYGIAVTTAEGEARWQIVGQLADSERHDHGEQPVEGAPAAWTEAVPGDNPEGWLAAAIGKAESPEVARIDRWSVRDGDSRQGLTVYFHNGAKAYVRKL
ncbi:hypothetical protein [Streptomyces sp. TRM70350]|uniref:hypothetical protein n=1 Tax=Streptomyces sp. TRM70350 TaxID=2856165 RepID=UPI001C455A21|nr:hypothetical protein [Streptomyces sp. TRM70350]MBV7697725.1 hypothetical protein [Streptomyces sp. TRM70350]